MQCHYDVMELPSRSVSVEEVKKQYKKLALKYHPDRNYGEEEAATAKFKLVSAAYAVLSDPQERKWYDDHRDSILRGGDGTNRGGGSGGKSGGGGLGSDVDVEDLWSYFNASCYSGYGEDPLGFYSVYGSIFDAMVAQEDKASEHLTDSPPFGTSASMPADVIRFYGYWSNFITCLSFSWEDEYNPADAPNRQVRRVIEKENKKAREVGRKKYMDIVRALVAYVKKRDPRMEAIEAENKRQREADNARREQARLDEQARRAEMRQRLKERTPEEEEEERRRRADERKGAFLLADNSSSSEDEIDIYGDAVKKSKYKRRNRKSSANRKAQDNARTAYAEAESDASDGEEAGSTSAAAAGSGNEEDADEEEEEEVYSCDVCQKSFKSQSQLEQHNQSKAHRKIVKQSEKKGGNSGGKAKSGKAASLKASIVKGTAVAAAAPAAEESEDDDDDDDMDAALLDSMKILGLGGAAAGGGEGEHFCSVCSQRFETRNMLFAHIKDLGHAATKDADATNTGTNKKKKVRTTIGGLR